MRATSLSARFERWIADEGALRRWRFASVLAGVYALFSATFISINAFTEGRRASTLYLPGEERIPFLPLFEYLYVLTFFIPALLIVSVRTYDRFRHLMHALGIALFVAYSTYLLVPARIDRPRLEVSSLDTWLLSVQYLDKPHNLLPSLHVTFSWLVVLSAQGSRGFRIGLAVLAAGISISTLFVKQHYIVDVVAGFVLAWVAWKVTAPPAS